MVNKILSKKEKRGWVRIAEAGIAIMIIAGVLLTMYIKSSQERDFGSYIYDSQKRVLNKIATNSTLRDAVLNNQLEIINNSIKREIPSNIGFDFKICDLGNSGACSFSNSAVLDQEKSIYAADRIIAANPYAANFNPKKIRLFFWIKG